MTHIWCRSLSQAEITKLDLALCSLSTTCANEVAKF